MDIRCFISVELPLEIKRSIDEKTKALRDSGDDVKWVRIENLHITLKFLGKTPEARLPEIKDRLTSAVSPLRSFSIEFASAGAFPNVRYPRIVWLGIRNSEHLVRLQSAVEMALTAIGFEPEERQFKPHLTIGRVKSARGKEALVREIENLKGTVFGKIQVENISIMKSELHPKGSKYTRLDDIPLMTEP
ncbi:MAG: RNA 2',3'-cyclic phosphodiesterase [Nitrospirae bacterium]|nr:RNA 2',3'-cyclic phosphodiesterase [Nitrospirota bacterium]